MRTRTRSWTAALTLVPLLLLGIVLVAPLTPAAPAVAADAPCPPPVGTAPAGARLVELHRVYHHVRGDHFHVTSYTEALSAASIGYTYEGLTGHISGSPAAGLVPFFRLWNPGNGDHFHTTSAAEVSSALATGEWVSEGISGYVYPPHSGKGIPFYRVYNPDSGDHLLTTDVAEVAAAAKDGYVYEGIAAEIFS